MLRVLQVILFYALLVWLGFLLLAGNILCLPLVLLPGNVRKPFVQRCISELISLFLWSAVVCRMMKLDLNALDALNGKSSVMLVANHPSMIDVFLIVSRVHRTSCLMKASIAGNLFLGIGARMAGYVSNRRTDRMLRSAINSLREGNLLLAFPEGTRTTRQPLNRLRPGFALIAKRASSPMQTLLIETNSAYLGKGWKIWKAPEFPLIYRVTLGDVIEPSASVIQTVAELQDYFETAIHTSIDPQLVI